MVIKSKKKLFIILFISLIIFMPLVAKDNSLKVMSFNIQGNSKGHNYADSDTVYLIAKIIDKSEADIVLLQEVYLEHSFIFPNALQKKLNVLTRGNWDYKTTYDYASCDSNQHNIVLFNKKIVTFGRDIGAEDFFRKEHVKYNFMGNKTQVLQFKHNSKDFIIVNVHLSYNDFANRRAELEEVGKIYSKYRINTPIIIGGDFNFSRREIKSSALGNAIIDGDSGFFADYQGQGTTLKCDENVIAVKNDYDHLIVKNATVVKQMSPVLFSRNKGQNTSYKETVRLGRFKFKSSSAFRIKISDHIPIKIEVAF